MHMWQVNGIKDPAVLKMLSDAAGVFLAKYPGEPFADLQMSEVSPLMGFHYADFRFVQTRAYPPHSPREKPGS